MSALEQALAEAFVCARCTQQGAQVERLAMSGTGLSRLLDIQAHRYAFASCPTCGYTEIYNLRTLEGRADLDTFFEILFSN